MSQCLVCDKGIDLEFGDGQHHSVGGSNYDGFVCSRQCQSDYERGICSARIYPNSFGNCKGCGRHVHSGGHTTADNDTFCKLSCYEEWSRRLSNEWM